MARSGTTVLKQLMRQCNTPCAGAKVHFHNITSPYRPHALASRRLGLHCKKVTAWGTLMCIIICIFFQNSVYYTCHISHQCALFKVCLGTEIQTAMVLNKSNSFQESFKVQSTQFQISYNFSSSSTTSDILCLTYFKSPTLTS